MLQILRHQSNYNYSGVVMLNKSMDLQTLNDYLKSVVDLIPAQSYLQQSNSKTAGGNSKRKGTKRSVKNKTNQSLTPAKRKKSNESFMKTTSAHITIEMNSTGDPIEKDDAKRVEKISGSVQTLTALQKRLKDRISEIQGQRNPKNKSPEEIAQVRVRRKKERTKMKMKAKLKRQQSLKTGAAALEIASQLKQNSMVSSQKSSKTHHSDEPAMFSKFEFNKDIESKNHKVKSRKGNKLRSLLMQAENKKQKLEEIKENEPERAENMMKKDSWGKALAKAEGTKVRDNPDLLRKSLKKEQALKKQHAKKWKERDDKVEEKMRQKQEKRTKNIKARKHQMKEKKMAKRAKKFLKSTGGFS